MNHRFLSQIRTVFPMLVLATAMASCGSTTVGSTAASSVPSSTVPSSVESWLTVDTPVPGEVVTSPAVLIGTSSSPQIGYRLYAGGDITLTEGTVESDPQQEGRFEVTIEFTNTCCMEMTLEVFSIDPEVGSGPTTVSIPLAYPESG